MGIRADQKEKRRQDIFNTALDLFIHKGYAGTSVRDIAGALEISPGLLFHYFAAKEDMLAEMMQMAMQGVSSATDIFKMSISPIEKFEMITRLIIGSFSSYPQSAQLFLLVHQVAILDTTPPKVKAMFSENHAVEMSVPVIIEGQRLGCIRDGDPLALSLTFWGAIQGVAETHAMNPGSPVPEPEWLTAILKS